MDLQYCYCHWDDTYGVEEELLQDWMNILREEAQQHRREMVQIERLMRNLWRIDYLTESLLGERERDKREDEQAYEIDSRRTVVSDSKQKVKALKAELKVYDAGREVSTVDSANYRRAMPDLRREAKRAEEISGGLHRCEGRADSDEVNEKAAGDFEAGEDLGVGAVDDEGEKEAEVEGEAKEEETVEPEKEEKEANGKVGNDLKEVGKLCDNDDIVEPDQNLAFEVGEEMQVWAASSQEISGNRKATDAVMQADPIESPRFHSDEIEGSFTEAHDRKESQDAERQISHAAQEELKQDTWSCAALTSDDLSSRGARAPVHQYEDMCGYLLVGGQCCKCHVGNVSAMGPLVTSCEGAPSSPTECPLHLSKLSTLAHCSNHDKTALDQLRVDERVLALAESNDQVKSLATLSCRIREVIGPINVTCVHCGVALGEQQVRNQVDVMGIMVEPAVVANQSTRRFFLHLLDMSSYCTCHAMYCTDKRAEEWDISIEGLLPGRVCTRAEGYGTWKDQMQAALRKLLTHCGFTRS